jgi:hypothetical protein
MKVLIRGNLCIEITQTVLSLYFLPSLVLSVVKISLKSVGIRLCGSMVRNKYKDFKFIDKKTYFNENEINDKKYSPNNLLHIIIDIHLLARSDFLVCTMSSNVRKIFILQLALLSKNGVYLVAKGIDTISSVYKKLLMTN